MVSIKSSNGEVPRDTSIAFRGEKPGDLPVQAPTKYELAIYLNIRRTRCVSWLAIPRVGALTSRRV